MEAGRERIDLGGGYTAYAHNLGYGVYGPDGWKAGDRKTLEGARSLAQRTAHKAQTARAVVR